MGAIIPLCKFAYRGVKNICGEKFAAPCKRNYDLNPKWWHILNLLSLISSMIVISIIMSNITNNKSKYFGCCTNTGKNKCTPLTSNYFLQGNIWMKTDRIRRNDAGICEYKKLDNKGKKKKFILK